MKKTIIVAEMLYPDGHKSLNNKIIKILAQKYNVIVLNYNDYFDESQIDSVIFRRLHKQIIIRHHEPFIRASIIWNMHIIKKSIRELKYDVILFLSINNYVSIYLKKLFSGKPVIVIHHNDIDIIKSDKKLNEFKRGMLNVEHIVFSDYIKNGLINKTNCPLNMIHTIPHPITMKIENLEKKRKPMIVGISLGNDKEFVKKCIDIDKNLSFHLSYKIIFRTKDINYTGNNLEVFSGYLSEEKYVEYYRQSAAIIIVYPNTFSLRYSGTLVNGITQNGRVLINKILMGVDENSKYKNIIKLLDDPIDLFKLVDSFFDSNIDINERNRFLKDHDDSKFLENFDSLIMILDENKNLLK